MGLFGQSKKKDPKEAVKEWTSRLRKEGRILDRQIWGIQREEEKAKQQLRTQAKKGQKEACTILAKEIVRTRKAVSKIHVAKAQLKSVEYSMNEQLATIKMAGTLEKSTQVMQSMQRLCKVSEIQSSMREMSKEMMKAGIIEEMLEDTLESIDDSEELEEAAQEEVDKILFEITKGAIGQAPEAVTDTLPLPVDAEEEGAMAAGPSDDMQARLEALRS